MPTFANMPCEFEELRRRTPVSGKCYQILAPLGAGGMGEVYRARDTKLEREVAIKILPEAVDLFVVRYVDWDPAKETWCGATKPGYRQYCNPKLYNPLPNALHHNQGDGTIRDVSLVANDTTPNSLFHNEGDGKFREAALTIGVELDCGVEQVSLAAGGRLGHQPLQ